MNNSNKIKYWNLDEDNMLINEINIVLEISKMIEIHYF